MKGLDEWITRDDREPIIPTRWAIEGWEEWGTFETKQEGIEAFKMVFTQEEYPEDNIYKVEGVK